MNIWSFIDFIARYLLTLSSYLWIIKVGLFIRNMSLILFIYFFLVLFFGIKLINIGLEVHYLLIFLRYLGITLCNSFLKFFGSSGEQLILILKQFIFIINLLIKFFQEVGFKKLALNGLFFKWLDRSLIVWLKLSQHVRLLMVFYTQLINFQN